MKCIIEIDADDPRFLEIVVNTIRDFLTSNKDLQWAIEYKKVEV